MSKWLEPRRENVTLFSHHACPKILRPRLFLPWMWRGFNHPQTGYGHIMIKIRIIAAIAAALALFFTAAPAQAGPKPPPSQTVTYSAPNVPLVDDDGVTRNFFVVYNFAPATSTEPSKTTCSYAINGRDVTNPAHPNHPSRRPTSLLVLEGTHRTTGTTVITNSADAITYCVSVFPERVRMNPDPTI